jgi:hypothetical protein
MLELFERTYSFAAAVTRGTLVAISFIDERTLSIFRQVVCLDQITCHAIAVAYGNVEMALCLSYGKLSTWDPRNSKRKEPIDTKI